MANDLVGATRLAEAASDALRAYGGEHGELDAWFLLGVWDGLSGVEGVEGEWPEDVRSLPLSGQARQAYEAGREVAAEWDVVGRPEVPRG